MKNFKLKDKYRFGFPEKSGLYDPQFEKDSCGVGLVANIKGIPSREIMDDAFHVNSKMDHRGGCGFADCRRSRYRRPARATARRAFRRARRLGPRRAARLTAKRG